MKASKPRQARAPRAAGFMKKSAMPRGREAEEIVQAIGRGEVDALVVVDNAHEQVVSLANFGTLHELNEVVRAIRAGEVDALVVHEDGRDRVFTLADMRRAIGESEDRFRQLAESMPGIVFTARPDGRMDYFNGAWWSFTGLDEASPESYDFGQSIDPAQREAFRNAWENCVCNGTCFEMELQLLRSENNESLWHLVRAIPVRDQDGAILRWFGVCTDIDRVKRSAEELERQRRALQHVVSTRTHQLEESQNKLRLSERMTVLGTLAAGIGHDFSNLLFPILSHLERLENEAGLSERAVSDLQALRTCTMHLKRLISGLRTFAIDPFQVERGESTALEEWCEEIQPLLTIALPRKTKLERAVDRGLPRVAIGTIPLTQAVFNLVLNSAHALGDRRDGRIQVWAKAGLEDSTVLVGVTDNGPGMDQETRRRCLEPFFTTKAGSCSTGLGLALVHQIVQQARGEVEIDSEPGRGTTVVLKLPEARGEPETAS